jgi:hypothetical protein
MMAYALILCGRVKFSKCVRDAARVEPVFSGATRNTLDFLYSDSRPWRIRLTGELIAQGVDFRQLHSANAYGASAAPVAVPS